MKNTLAFVPIIISIQLIRFMRKNKYQLMWLALILAPIFYIGGAFIYSSFNPSLWPINDKKALCALYPAFTIIIFCVIKIEEE